jgi:hypothetical protein
MNNRPVGGCSSETQCHPIDMNNNKDSAAWTVTPDKRLPSFQDRSEFMSVHFPSHDIRTLGILLKCTMSARFELVNADYSQTSSCMCCATLLDPNTVYMHRECIPVIICNVQKLLARPLSYY